jgi:hypothetical protein
MGRMTGRSRFPIDGSLILRAQAQATLSASTTFAIQKLAQTGAFWQNPGDPVNGTIFVVGEIESVSGSPTGLTVDTWVYDDVNLTNPVLADSVPVVSGEWFEIPVDYLALLRDHPTKTYWAPKVTITGGTSPTVGIFIYLAPDWDQ